MSLLMCPRLLDNRVSQNYYYSRRVRIESPSTIYTYSPILLCILVEVYFYMCHGAE